MEVDEADDGEVEEEDPDPESEYSYTAYGAPL